MLLLLLLLLLFIPKSATISVITYHNSECLIATGYVCHSSSSHPITAVCLVHRLPTCAPLISVTISEKSGKCFTQICPLQRYLLRVKKHLWCPSQPHFWKFACIVRKKHYFTVSNNAMLCYIWYWFDKTKKCSVV